MSKYHLIVIVLVCVGKICAQDPFDYDKNKNGLIVGTITFPKEAQWFDLYKLRLKKENGGSIRLKIESYQNVNSPTPANDYIKTYIFIAERSPGKYFIDDITAFGVDPEEASYHGRVKDISIPIEVRKGEIIYIGDIQYKEFLKDNFVHILMADHWERDLRYFKSKYPTVDWTRAVKEIAKPQNVKK